MSRMIIPHIANMVKKKIELLFNNQYEFLVEHLVCYRTDAVTINLYVRTDVRPPGAEYMVLYNASSATASGLVKLKTITLDSDVLIDQSYKGFNTLCLNDVVDQIYNAFINTGIGKDLKTLDSNVKCIESKEQ